MIAINIAAKKFLAYYLDSDIEVKIWGIKRFGFTPSKEFKKPFPMGIFLPIIISALTFGNAMWLASLVFDVKAKTYRAAKRHGLYSYSDITEYQIGLIAAAGIVANLIFAIIGYFAGWSIFTRLNIWYAFFNLIPLSDIDGNKIFFGNLVMWSFLATIATIAVVYAFILI
jgi:Zn-dependent protease